MSIFTSSPSPGFRVICMVSLRAATAFDSVVTGAAMAGGAAAASGFGSASAAASAASEFLISPILVKPSTLPRPVGSIAYSDGSTTVLNSTAAVRAAQAVERRSWRGLGSSARVGISVLYILESNRLIDEIAGQLIADQHEATRHHGDVGCVCVTQETAAAAP